jgi:hypothetical protein
MGRGGDAPFPFEGDAGRGDRVVVQSTAGIVALAEKEIGS